MIFSSRYPSLTIPDVDFYTFVMSGTYDESRPILLDHLTKDSKCLREVKEESKRIARGLREKLNFGKGKVLAIAANNRVDYISVLLGTVASGGACMTVNSQYNAEEMAHQLSNSRAEVMVTTEDLAETVKEAAKIAGSSIEYIYVLDNKDSPKYLWTALASDNAEMDWSLDPEEFMDSPAILIYSSGTTGKPKGVELTHRNLVSTLVQLGSAVKSHIAAVIQDTTLNVSPMCYISGVFMNLVSVMSGNMLVVLPDRYTFRFLLGVVEQYRIKNLLVPPNIINLLSKSPEVDEFDLSNLKQAVYFGGPMSRLVCDIAEKRLGISVSSGYGMTECCGGFAIRDGSEMPPESVGVIMPNCRLKIVDEEGKQLSYGEKGEICVSGPGVMRGYFNNPDATRQAFDEDGFYHTGDVGYIDENNNIYVVDRIKEIIKYDNNQVAPAELEELLLIHPAVSEAAVIGYPSEKQQTELPCGCVVLKQTSDNHQELADQITKHVNSRVADYKQLRAGVVFVNDIPRNSHGKILRRILRTEVQRTHPQAAVL
ncbi:acetyl-CoA synthetase-like protein [Basidiobolus meristosporus CBS 931.73]|uniref:Acetyl-CoA synthetase-like protein n=1 Tax=Basidiobolus meristosporus CBS 931.73 TaxID=1314790 RepID=A0A1Y1Y7Y5_9FUNG|nr:acetyl-CoA synthetase-like protein [Basidiobolus meristosporus CBS 931.73]|eukprot:ORX94131.1 acetyl-CoA synthetase-like protein [Basidiobolus meristosporus CBS 931.73]